MVRVLALTPLRRGDLEMTTADLAVLLLVLIVLRWAVRGR